MAKVAKYTPAMEMAIRALAEAGPINAESAENLVNTHEAFAGSDITTRGVIAKVRTMGLPYAKKEKVSKDGSPVATKEALAGQIAALVGVASLPSLAKAEKRDLKALLSALSAGEAGLAEVG